MSARLAVAAGLALLAAGCGGSAVRGTGSTASGSLAVAGCMRAHGVPNWPDPDSSGGFDKAKLTPRRLGASDAAIEAARAACQHLLANGGRPPSQAQLEQERAQALQFSRCIRAHGVPSFPDPVGTGRMRIPDPASVGIDQGSPKFEAANSACATYRPPYMPSNAAYNAWARAHPGGS